MPTEQPTHQQVVASTAATAANMRPQNVPVNVYETAGALVILAVFPAVRPEDVTIERRGRTVRFWARLRSAGLRDYLVHEWDYGGYEREIELPDGYGGAVEALLSNGQLAIRVLRGTANEPVTVSPLLR